MYCLQKQIEKFPLLLAGYKIDKNLPAADNLWYVPSLSTLYKKDKGKCNTLETIHAIVLFYNVARKFIVLIDSLFLFEAKKENKQINNLLGNGFIKLHSISRI